MVRTASTFLQNLGLVLKLVDQVIDRLDELTALSLGRLGNLQGLETGLDIDAQISGGKLGEGLLLGLHDVGERCVSGDVKAEIGGQDGGEGGLDSLDSSVNLTGDGHRLVAEFNLRGEGGLIS